MVNFKTAFSKVYLHKVLVYLPLQPCLFFLCQGRMYENLVFKATVTENLNQPHQASKTISPLNSQKRKCTYNIWQGFTKGLRSLIIMWPCLSFYFFLTPKLWWSTYLIDPKRETMGMGLKHLSPCLGRPVLDIYSLSRLTASCAIPALEY